MLKRALGVVAILIGTSIMLWFVYNLVRPTAAFKLRSVFQLVLPGLMIWYGWRWMMDIGPGLQDQQIDLQAPELSAAVAEAQRTMPAFLKEVQKHLDGAYVKFPLVTDKGVTEHIWAYVHHHGDGVFNVSLANTPYTQEGQIGTRRDVPESDVEDWQIMFPDGRIRGAFSTVAAFRYLDRTGVRMNSTLRKQRAQLIDAAEQPVAADDRRVGSAARAARR